MNLCKHLIFAECPFTMDLPKSLPRTKTKTTSAKERRLLVLTREM